MFDLTPSLSELHGDLAVGGTALDERSDEPRYRQDPDAFPAAADPDEAELEALYGAEQCERAARVAAARPAAVRFELSVAVKGKRFAAAVVGCGRRFNAGTYATEPAAWLAAQRLAAELRDDANHAA